MRRGRGVRGIERRQECVRDLEEGGYVKEIEITDSGEIQWRDSVVRPFWRDGGRDNRESLEYYF